MRSASVVNIPTIAQCDYIILNESGMLVPLFFEWTERKPPYASRPDYRLDFFFFLPRLPRPAQPLIFSSSARACSSRLADPRSVS